MGNDVRDDATERVQNPPLKGEEKKEGSPAPNNTPDFSTDYSPGSLSKARSLRREMTRAEHVLWQALRGNQTGFYFRRQVPIGEYVADFVCLKSHLIVEVDGGGHYDEERVTYDAARTLEFRRRRFDVMRFSNRDVLTNLEGVFRAITGRLRRGTER